MNICRNVDRSPITRKMLKNAVCYAMLLGISLASSESFAGIFLSVNIAPPILPVYTQPVAPGPGYIFTPGYWSYGDDGYFWVPGTWVLAPFTGALWTPGYWGWGGGQYVFHTGYWGPHIGFYGGVNYGFGYSGHGYEGGYWQNGAFSYNRAVNNINTTNITNVYNKTVINNGVVNRVSFNGGAGGIAATENAQEAIAAHDTHTPPLALQQSHVQAASQNAALRASVNHGAPSIAATPTPGAFSASNVSRATASRQQVAATTATSSRPQLGATRTTNAVANTPVAHSASSSYAPHTASTNSTAPNHSPVNGPSRTTQINTSHNTANTLPTSVHSGGPVNPTISHVNPAVAHTTTPVTTQSKAPAPHPKTATTPPKGEKNR